MPRTDITNGREFESLRKFRLLELSYSLVNAQSSQGFKNFFDKAMTTYFN